MVSDEALMRPVAMAGEDLWVPLPARIASRMARPVTR